MKNLASAPALLAPLLAGLLLPGAAFAAASANYNLPTADLNNGAGPMESTSYRLSSSVGAALPGSPMSGGTVALGSGLIAQIDRPIAALTSGSISFGTQGVSFTSAPLAVTVFNRGVAPLNISAVSVAGADFAVLPTNCTGATLATNASCSVSVTFTPTGATGRVGSLSIVSNGVIPAVSLSGTGVLNLQVITFGTLPSLIVGGSGTLTASASSGLAPVVLTSTSPGICTVSGNTLTGAGVGTCTINASQAGNGVWAAASASASLSVVAATSGGGGADGDVPLPSWALGLLGAGLLAGMRRRRRAA